MKVKIVPKIIDKTIYPRHVASYQRSHRVANAAERAIYPKQYKTMKKIDAKMGKNELAGDHDRKGNIKVSRKVGKNIPTTILHEVVEWICQKCGKKNCAKHFNLYNNLT